MGSGAGLKVDGGVSSQLANVVEAATTLERRGYDGCWTAEVNHDPFLPLTLAAEHTDAIELGTSIAVAFARNPMTVANVGWDLQEYSGGRLNLGLGSQIQPHIEKRFSMPWSRPVPRMREFVLAMREIWTCWRDGSKLSFEGEFYTHKLMTPMFTPEPHDYDFPKVFVAAVGEAMTEMAGEVADGVLAHAFTTKRYFEEVTMPALMRGMARVGSAAQRLPGVVSGVRRDRARRVRARRRRGRHPQADRLLRVDPRLPQGSRTARLGRAAGRAAQPVAARATGTAWVRSSTTRCSKRSPSSRRSTSWPPRSAIGATA